MFHQFFSKTWFFVMPFIDMGIESICNTIALIPHLKNEFYLCGSDTPHGMMREYFSKIPWDDCKQHRVIAVDWSLIDLCKWQLLMICECWFLKQSLIKQFSIFWTVKSFLIAASTHIQKEAFNLDFFILFFRNIFLFRITAMKRLKA